eukprot:NODE_3233_length_799_cov_45.456000_g2698_i0.p1 GENE.NODE_3233_length_799_cov_45.456000_g2698_i0~~NODE_3233_length_799_cov_45.456000_g2698_i0.p1  ORF type:complete len:191 (-),score=30.33 NODE_3233_length_799_cov_45.456000_g2698_i0:47-619(-)
MLEAVPTAPMPAMNLSKEHEARLGIRLEEHDLKLAQESYQPGNPVLVVVKGIVFAMSPGMPASMREDYGFRDITLKIASQMASRPLTSPEDVVETHVQEHIDSMVADLSTRGEVHCCLLTGAQDKFEMAFGQKFLDFPTNRNFIGGLADRRPWSFLQPTNSKPSKKCSGGGLKDHDSGVGTLPSFHRYNW